MMMHSARVAIFSDAGVQTVMLDRVKPRTQDYNFHHEPSFDSFLIFFLRICYKELSTVLHIDSVACVGFGRLSNHFGFSSSFD
jgi:hypothetical protein